LIARQLVVFSTMSSMLASRPAVARVAVTPADANLASLGAARCVKDVPRAGVAASRADQAKRAVANRAVQREPAE